MLRALLQRCKHCKENVLRRSFFGCLRSSQLRTCHSLMDLVSFERGTKRVYNYVTLFTQLRRIVGLASTACLAYVSMLLLLATMAHQVLVRLTWARDKVENRAAILSLCHSLLMCFINRRKKTHKDTVLGKAQGLSPLTRACWALNRL